MSTDTAIPTKFSWYLSVAAVLLIFVVIGIYSSRMAHETTGYDEEQAQIRLATLHKMQDADRKTLTTADWIDKDKGIVRIPIDEAVQQEVPLLQAKPLTMGAPIPGATPAPPSGATPATTAPPAGNPTTPGVAGSGPASSSAAGTTNAAPTGSAPTTTQTSK